MRFSATIRPHQEEIFWAYFKECKGNSNTIMASLLNTALLCEALMRQRAAADAAESSDTRRLAVEDDNDDKEVTDASL